MNSGGMGGKGGKPAMMGAWPNQMHGGKGPAPPGGKPGDWTCPNCGDLVFASKFACKMCGTPKNSGMGGGMGGCMGGMFGVKGCMGKGPAPPGGKPGDWHCPNCGDLVFGSKAACKMCGTPKPHIVDMGGAKEHKPGDWVCPQCQNLNFAKNTTCKQCNTPALGVPRLGIKPGDWVCPNCGDLVFANKAACKMCGTPQSMATDKPKPANPMNYLGIGQARIGGQIAKPGDWQSLSAATWCSPRGPSVRCVVHLRLQTRSRALGANQGSQVIGIAHNAAI